MYFLRSLKKADQYYIGSSGNLKRRLETHNGADAGWTKRYQPWEIFYTEEYATRAEAVSRERYLKSKEGIAEKLHIIEVVKRNP